MNVSIIIPHYNASNTLNQLISSIPDFENIQVIIVDDNSCEKEFNELQRIKRKRENVELYVNSTNKKGAGVCRNIGLMYATGNWLLFADADDYFVEDMYNIAARYFNSDLDIIFFTPTSIEIDTDKKSVRHLPYKKLIDNVIKKNKYAELKLKYFFVVPWSKLIKREIVVKHNLWFDEVIASNDVMFSTKLSYAVRNYKVSNEIIYCVTRKKGSLTTTISEEVFNSRLNVFLNQYKFLKTKLHSNEFKQLRLNGIPYIIYAYKLGFKRLFKTVYILTRNGITIINYRNINPTNWVKYIKYLISVQRKEKKYNVKK